VQTVDPERSGYYQKNGLFQSSHLWNYLAGALAYRSKQSPYRVAGLVTHSCGRFPPFGLSWIKDPKQFQGDFLTH
jgi:hypothetical protein